MRIFENLLQVLDLPELGKDSETNVTHVFFDLDGTLTDPGIGITNSVMYALQKMDIEPPCREKLYAFIGPPLIESFQKYYGMSDEEARKAVDFYREYFSEKGLFENTPYEGIHSQLEYLRKKDYKLVVATSKPEPFSKRIIERFELDSYFDFLAGSSLEETRTKKDEVIKYALLSLGLDNDEAKKHILMVGDRLHDVNGAHSCGIKCAGVLYGYGSEAEMRECGADYIVKGI